MSRFIESIRFENDGYLFLSYHQARMDTVFQEFFNGKKPHQLQDILPNLDLKMKQKVRLVYDADSFEVTHEVYNPRQVKSIKIVRSGNIQYAHKYENREELDALYNSRGNADDILIIKNGLVTDSYYANPVFWDGTEWLVPKTYLLNGVKRQYLLATGKVREAEIREEDIASFKKLSLINAMLDLGGVEVAINNIFI